MTATMITASGARAPELATNDLGTDELAIDADATADWAWVLAAPFRAHVERVLTEEPLPWRALAGHLGIPDNVIRSLLGAGGCRRAHRIAPHYARALMALEPTCLRADLRRPAAATSAVLTTRGLLAAGWPLTRIAAMGAVAPWRLAALLRGEPLLITRRSELLLKAAGRAFGLHLEDEDVLADNYPVPRPRGGPAQLAHTPDAADAVHPRTTGPDLDGPGDLASQRQAA